MKTIFTKFAAASLMLAAVACQREDMLDGNTQNGSSVELVPLTISATLESGLTKTTLQAGGKVHWESGDAITVLGVAEDGTVALDKFTTTDEGEEATFTNADGVAPAKDYYVIYPHTDAERLPYLNSTTYKSWMCTVENSLLRVYFPSMQKVSAIDATSTSLDAYSVGVVAEDGTVAFKNLGGLIKINIPVEGVEHVILYGNADETIVGNAYVSFDEEGLPNISSLNGSNTVRIVPASGNTFEPGDYYINVLPVVFSKGLSVIFTKSNNTWASKCSRSSFVVERSKISSFPEIGSLSFGGKVVDIISVNEKTGKASQPFTDGTDDTNPPPPSSNSYPKTEKVYTLTDGGYPVKIYGYNGHSKTTQMGLQFGKKTGDYVELPGISGYALNKIVVRCAADANGAGSPMIQTASGASVIGGEVWGELAKPFNVEYTWSFSGNAGEAYKIIRTTDENKYTPFPQIRLYYADAPNGESSIKPLITSVTTADPDIDPYVGKATFNGSFTAVDYTLSALSCGFEYKKVSENEWTSVTCSPTATEFSYEFTDEAGDEYVYRAWTKVNKTDKTVYGNEVQVNARKLILRLVFDDNYMTREDKYNFLLREWGWGTNANAENENLNGVTYDYNYKEIAYPFTFWSYRPSATSGGYALWATNGSKKVYGLSLSYVEDLAESQPAWMQMPGPADFKLVEVYATLYENFAGTISASVDDDGNATGDPLATFTKRSSFPLKLEGTAEETRYYFCTTSNQRPTLRNLTLTYLYVGE